jgi:hypothetical protein
MDELSSIHWYSFLDSEFGGRTLDPGVISSFSEGQPLNISATCNIDAPNPLRRSRKSKAATLHDEHWEPYKGRIIDLHITQNKPLPEVIDIMKGHGLDAKQVGNFTLPAVRVY